MAHASICLGGLVVPHQRHIQPPCCAWVQPQACFQQLTLAKGPACRPREHADALRSKESVRQL